MSKAELDSNYVKDIELYGLDDFCLKVQYTVGHTKLNLPGFSFEKACLARSDVARYMIHQVVQDLEFSPENFILKWKNAFGVPYSLKLC